MATTIDAGSLANAFGTVGRTSIFDEAITLTGVTELEDQYLAMGWPAGTAGSSSYFGDQNSSLKMLRGGLDITAFPKATTNPSDASENQTSNRNHTFRNGAGVDLEDLAVYIRGNGQNDNDHRFGFGSPTLGTDPMRLVNVDLYADNCRLIMQLNHFTPELRNVGIDDFTFANARADWNVKPGVFTGLASGANSDVDINNGNVSGQNAGSSLGGTTYFPGYQHRRRASSGTTPNAPHRTSLKGLYFVYLDPEYLIIESDLSVTAVLAPSDLTEWNEAFSSADTASGQRASVGTGCLVANRFAVEMRNAVGGTPQGLRTWVTNADNSAFNTIQCYNLAQNLTTTASTNTDDRPSVRSFTLNTPIIDNAVIAVSAGVTDTVESLASGVIPYNIGADYGFVTSVYGYSKASVENVNPLELNILRRLQGQELNYVVPVSTLFSQQVTSLNSVVSRFHNTDIIQAPLVDAGWTVTGNALNLGTATVSVGNTSSTFDYTTDDDTINLPFDVLEDIRTANESNIGSLLVLNELLAENIVISGANSGAVSYSATALMTFNNTAALVDGTFTGPTGTLNVNTSITGANSWNFTTINGWRILTVANQDFTNTDTINTSGSLGNWTTNTYGSTITINIDNSFDATLWDVADGEIVTFTSASAVDINLTTIQLASGRYVSGANVSFVTPAVQATIVRVNLNALTNGSVFDIYRDHSNIPLISGTISGAREIFFSNAIASGGTGTEEDPLALSTAADLDVYYTKDDRTEFRYTHTITLNTATVGQPQVYDVSTAITAASDAANTPSSVINIDDKASPATGAIDANGRILIDPTNISPLDVVDDEAVYGRILAITRGSTNYLTALRLQDLHFNTTIPATGLSGGIFQFLGQTNVNMRGATLPGGSDGFYKFIDMEAELQLYRGVYDSGPNFEPRSTDRDRLMICTDGAFGTDMQQVHTMIRQLNPALTTARETINQLVAEGLANIGINSGDPSGMRLDVTDVIATKN